MPVCGFTPATPNPITPSIHFNLVLTLPLTPFLLLPQPWPKKCPTYTVPEKLCQKSLFGTLWCSLNDPDFTIEIQQYYFLGYINIYLRKYLSVTDRQDGRSNATVTI